MGIRGQWEMTKQVDFLETTLSGQKVFLTVAIQGGRLVAVAGELKPRFAAEMEDMVRLLPKYKDVTPTDGDRFLEALRFAYSGSIVRASRPYEAL